MRRKVVALVVVLVVAGVLATLGGDAWAQGADPLGLIVTAATIPYFNADLNNGNLFIVLIASPTGDNGAVTIPRSHMWFYSADCVRIDSAPVPMSENDSEVVLVTPDAPTFVTLTEGSILIAGTTNNIDQISLQHSIVVRGAWLDALNNRARYIDPGAGLSLGHSSTAETTPSYITETSPPSNSNPHRWSPYDSGMIISFAPPDDGSRFVDTVIFSCPLGSAPNQLAYDMANSNVDDWSLFIEDSELVLDAPSIIQGAVYDLDEKHIADWTAFCRCVGAKKFNSQTDFQTQIRMRDLSLAYITNATYTEMRGQQASGDHGQRFLGYWFFSINFPEIPYNAELFGRMHHANPFLIGF